MECRRVGVMLFMVWKVLECWRQGAWDSSAPLLLNSNTPFDLIGPRSWYRANVSAVSALR